MQCAWLGSREKLPWFAWLGDRYQRSMQISKSQIAIAMPRSVRTSRHNKAAIEGSLSCKHQSSMGPPRKDENEWLTTTARHADTLEGRTEEMFVVREIPPKPNERQIAKPGSGVGNQPKNTLGMPASFKHLHAAFSMPEGSGQDVAFAEERAKAMMTSLDAARKAWLAIEQDLEAECFACIQELGQLARNNSSTLTKGTAPPLVPTLLLSSNSLAASDQAATYNHLQTHLKSQDAYTAMLQPSHFSHGVGSVISEILSQLAGQGGGEDMHALFQWYEDQTGSDAQQAIAARQLQQRHAGTPGPTDRSRTQATPDTAAPHGNTSTAKPGRKLRARKEQPLLAGQQLFGATMTARWQTNRQRQLVVLIRGAEQVPPLALQDLLAALLQDYRRFPATLVLGCSRPASLFLSCLPMGCRTRMAPHMYDLPSQEAKLKALVKGVLCGQPPPLILLSERPLLAVLQHYEHQTASSLAVMEAIEAAHVLHHASQPLALLAAPALCETAMPSAQQPRAEKEKAAGSVVDLADDSSDNDETSSDDDDNGKRKPRRGHNNSQQGLQDDSDACTPGLLRAMNGITVQSTGKRGMTRTVLEELIQRVPDSILLSFYKTLNPPSSSPGDAPVEDSKPVKAKKSGTGKRPPNTGKSKDEGANDIQTAQENVLQAVRYAVDTLARWRLGVLVCHQVATVAGACNDKAGRLTSCQHILNELCGPSGSYSLSNITDETILQNLAEDVCDAMKESQQWRPLTDIAACLLQLNALRHGEALNDEDVNAHDQDLKTPSKQRQATTSTDNGVEGGKVLSPTSIVRRGIASATITSPVGRGSKPSGVTLGFPANEQISLPSQSPSQEQGHLPTVKGVTATPAARQPQPSRPVTTNRASRRGLLQQHIQAAAASMQPQVADAQPADAVAMVNTQRPDTFQSKLADWLRSTLQQLLATCPFHLPGAAVFTFHDAKSLEDCCLHPAPRAALHDALTHPSRYLGANVIDEATPLSTDSEVAYQRIGRRDAVPVAGWFQDFCEVLAMNPKDYVAGAKSIEPAATTSTKGGKRKKRGDCDDQGLPGNLVVDNTQLQQHVIAWAARFSQAAAELQHMGIVRTSKRKKEQAVQVMFQPSEAPTCF